MSLTKIIPNTDNKQAGDGTLYYEEWERYSSDGFFPSSESVKQDEDALLSS